MFSPKDFLSEEILHIKNFWVKKNLWSKKIEVQQKFGPKIVQVQKNVGPKKYVPKKSVSKNFKTKTFGQKNKCWSKIISDQSLVKIRLVLADIFHYTSTRTYVAGTNVAWSNVPETVANKYR